MKVDLTRTKKRNDLSNVLWDLLVCNEQLSNNI